VLRLSTLLPSWKLALDAANKSPKTIISYLDSVKRLEAYLATAGLPLEAPGIRGLMEAQGRGDPVGIDIARRRVHVLRRY